MKVRVLLLTVFFLVICHANTASASIYYDINIDTSSIAGTSGSIDFQFNPGPTSVSAFSDVSNFTGSTLTGSPIILGSVSGVLPGTMTISDTTYFNDYFQEITYGSNLSFRLTLSGSPGSTFFFSMFSDPYGSLPLLTNDTANGFALLATMNPQGTATMTIYSDQATVSSVPLPATFLLFGSGLLSFIGFIRRRKVD